MKGTFTFLYLVNGVEQNITILYANPFVHILSLDPQSKAQVFNLCALSYVTGILDQHQTLYSNLRLLSMKFVN